MCLEEERSYKSGFFEAPIFMFFKQIQEYIKEGVRNFILKNGAKHDMSSSAKVLMII